MPIIKSTRSIVRAIKCPPEVGGLKASMLRCFPNVVGGASDEREAVSRDFELGAAPQVDLKNLLSV